MNRPDYEEIRPYFDHEVPGKIQLLLEDPTFAKVLSFLFPDPEKESTIRKFLARLKTVADLQHSFVYHFVEKIIESTTSGFTTSGLEQLDKKKSYLFISNHRDIILDAAFLNYVVARNGMNTTQIAIGDNLLIYDWITHLVKLNRAFVVRRNLGPRELLTASGLISSYIRESLTEKKMSVWIAQREGRTKDGNDQTQISLLKMLNLSNKNSIAEGFDELTIIPLSISYELEPCGISKVSEMIRRELDEFQKTQADDLKSMGLGIMNPKGRVHFSFGRPILTSFLQSNSHLPTNEFIQLLAERIDHRIHQYYKLWPNNYIAYDLMNGTGEFMDNYTAQEMVGFNKLLSAAQEALPFSDEVVRRKFLTMYARPVQNALIAQELFRS